MKNILIYCTLIFASTFKVYAHHDVFERYEIIPIEQFNKFQFFEKFKDLPEDQKNDQIIKNWNKNWVVEVKKGLELPIRPKIKGEFFHLTSQEKDIWVSVDKTIYIRVEDANFLFSEDLNLWEAPDKFFTGTFGLSYTDMDEGFPYFGLFAEFNKR